MDSASADAIGNKVVTEISNSGCSMIENQIPPFGEIHFLPDLPRPPVCFSGSQTRPVSNFGILSTKLLQV